MCSLALLAGMVFATGQDRKAAMNEKASNISRTGSWVLPMQNVQPVP